MDLNTYYTERLVLKVLDKSAAQMVLDYYIRNKEFLEKWEPGRDSKFYTVEFHDKQLEEDLEQMNLKRLLRLWIFEKDDESRIIGSIAFSNIVWGSFLSCFMGYKLDKDKIDKGYMTETVKKGIDIMFNEYGLHRIEGNILPRNKASIRVTEKLGFVCEGLSKKYLKINGVWEDHVHMVILNDNI